MSSIENEKKKSLGPTMACKTCLTDKPIDGFRKTKPHLLTRRKNCKECEKQKQKYWKKNNMDKVRDAQRKLYHKNKSNPIYMMRKRLRNQVSKILRTYEITKSKSTLKYIGCTVEDFKAHIEKQFKPGMAWDNYGTYWHIDHIIPIGLATTEEQVKELMFYTNLQPLEAEKNIKKGKKLEYVFI
jgi:hypothetical protein